jgi:hypothetical protein
MIWLQHTQIRRGVASANCMAKTEISAEITSCKLKCLRRSLSQFCFSVMILLNLLLVGCNSGKKPAHVALDPVRTRNVTVRLHPDYKRAEILFHAGERTKARSIFVGLLRNPTLTLQDKQFLQRQIFIADGNKTPLGFIGKTPIGARSSQTPSADCGPRALKIAAEAVGIPVQMATLIKVSKTNKDGTSLEGMILGAESLGLKSEGVQVDKDALSKITPPAVVWIDGNHYVALLKIVRNPLTDSVNALIHDPNESQEKSLPIEELLSRSGGIVLTLRR